MKMLIERNAQVLGSPQHASSLNCYGLDSLCASNCCQNEQKIFPAQCEQQVPIGVQ
jgi:hypothetical protein